MNREDFSLFKPQGSSAVYRPLSKEAINDLSVDFLCEALTKDPYELNIIKELLINITDDEEVIKYRSDIFEDFLKFPKLRENLTALLLKLKDLREIERFQKDTEASSLWQLINRLRELDGYVDCITAIKTTLEEINVKSEGLLKLKEMVQSIYADSGFPDLKKDIEELFEKARSLKSITLGVNLDNMLRPKTVGVISLNDKAFTDSGLLKRFISFASNQSELHHGNDVTGFTSFHPANPSTVSFGLGTAVIGAQNDVNDFASSSLTGADPMSDALKRVVTDILKRTVNNMKSTLNKYVGNSGYTFITLMPEITFYIRFAELADKILEKGFTLSKPEILKSGNRLTDAKGIYNIKLAIKALSEEDSAKAEDIITNDFKFDDSARIYILTGPNRGGKTTITQAVGLAFLLAQNGIYVPCDKMSLSPADNIFTHFPADENDTVDLGRLGEESKRLSEIFTSATKGSLLLLNESLATTNVSEGLYIAKDVIKAMRYLGVRCIFNTHMHDLARNLDEINSTIEGDSKIESMVTGVENGKRSFKIFIAPPQGVSYAKDIAEKYGVTFESIKREIDNKENNL
ncbi:MAG: DNA mismatch repair protein [Ruminococcus sp.]|nr:DNA mismatch repair protein [Ruminococcus sp.]